MEDVEKDHASVRNKVTPFAHVRQTSIGLSTQLTVIVDKTVVTAAYVFFELAAVSAVHLSVRVIGTYQHAVDNAPDAFVAGWILFLDPVQPVGEVFGRLI